MNDKIYVIAGTRHEADHWIKENAHKKWNSGHTSVSLSDYIYVDNPIRIRGIRDPHGVFIGSWIERKDMEEIFRTLLIATDITQTSHRVLTQMWGKWKENRPKPKSMTYSGTIQPVNPITGQFWYDDSDDTMKVYDGRGWLTTVKDYMKDD